MAASGAQEFHDLKPSELTVRGNSITGMVEIAILDADLKLVLTRQAVLDLIAKLAAAARRLDRRGDRARVPSRPRVICWDRHGGSGFGAPGVPVTCRHNAEEIPGGSIYRLRRLERDVTSRSHRGSAPSNSTSKLTRPKASGFTSWPFAVAAHTGLECDIAMLHGERGSRSCSCLRAERLGNRSSAPARRAGRRSV
jgi:hypothetical protein